MRTDVATGSKCGDPLGGLRYGYPPDPAAVSYLNARAGSWAPNTAVPATNTDAPDCAHGAIVSRSTPPSTSIAAFSPTTAFRRRSLSSDCGMNGWPPQPGLTVMHSTSSTSSSTSATASTGVPGLTTTPAAT